ncbi:MAG: PEP-CTERM sorting domain-containing protein [Planctomycetota bacterium]
MKKFAIVAFACLMLCVPPARADITWNVTYQDGNSDAGFGLGAGNPLGATRRSTFQAALDYISSVLDTPNDVTLDYEVRASLTGGTGSLASGGTSFFLVNGHTNGILYQHAQTGVDPSGGFDGFSQYDFGYNYNSENDAPASNEFDLYTIAVHEITHSLGYLTLTSSTGAGVFAQNPNTYSVSDSFLERGDGTDLFSNGSFVGSAADLVSNDVFFNGANAMAANGGNPVKMYAPTTFASGSSLSHVDTTTFPDAISAHAIAPGVKKTEYIGVELGILQDLGWQLKSSAVPEPSSMVLLGLLGGSMMLRRRRR